MIQLKSITISLLLKLYHFVYFTFLKKIILNLIEFIGGPIFIKILQSFNNFKRFKSNDIMTGSIGNVEIKNEIVKKSLKNNIDSHFDNSFTIFKKVIKLLQVELPFYYQDYYQINMKQLDLIEERNNSLKLKKIFENINRVEIIDIYQVKDNYHLSKYIIGYPIEEFLKNNNHYETEIYKLLNLSYYLMLSSNFFHCDWHFGNFLVNLNSNNKLILYILDTGLVGKLDNNDHYNKLKVLLTTNMLRPEPINIMKFLAYVNLNPDANIKNFIKESKVLISNSDSLTDTTSYKNILLIFIKNATSNQLKFPIVVFYMFQAIIFLNNCNNIVYDNISDYGRKNGFYQEIIKYLND